jgi:predicted metal-dependent HD superfamily phosphohydrolase
MCDHNSDHCLNKVANVTYAILFHDLIYDTGRYDNEAASAAEWRRFGTAIGVPTQQIEQVAAMIMATAAHTQVTPSTLDTDYFLDFDLSILGMRF